MLPRTHPLPLLFLATLLTSEILTKPALGVASSPPDTKSVCVTGLKEKLHQHDFQLNELKNQLEKTQTELRSLAEKYLEHNIFPPEDCKEVLRRGYKSSGMYKIKPLDAPEKFWVWCDMMSSGGGWTYVVNRFDGSGNFNRNWTEYKRGFGKIHGEFWMGLEHLHHLTNSKLNELRFELVDWNITKVYAKYETFVVGSEKEGYDVKILGNYSGNAGDSFGFHRKMKFSTPDKDQDTAKSSCAKKYEAGWWFLDCFYSLLTGKWVGHGYLGPKESLDKILWGELHRPEYSLKQARMMIRPID